MSMFKKATKAQIKIRLAISGASGSGKTFSALSIASYLGKSIALIDTEHGSASRYADKFQFDVCELENHHPGQYIQAIQAAEQASYEVIIIDSLSHAWFSELELAGKGFDGWKNVRPLERKLIDAMIGSKAHIIATMRSKTEYVMEEYTAKDGRSKTAPKKIGTAPVQSSGIEYEFDVAGEMDYQHILTISKSRCPELTDRTFLNPGREIAEILKNWMQGTEPQPAATPQFVAPPPKVAPAPMASKQLKVAAPTPKPSPATNPAASSAVADTLHRLKWTDFQIQNCLVANFNKVHPTELTDEELLDFLDYLAVFEATSAEVKRLKWTPEQGKDVLKLQFGIETRNNLNFKQLSEFLELLKQQPANPN
ncbi:ATP-binding protein [Microcoleus sp. D2_18a_B4]|uniref:ATP-binding protein n=1 Tax=Microcoleus sp. D2_18a_B4 TaxID=3055329 RepID=UPI002FD0BAF3